MRTTFINELAAAGLLLGSYPIDWIVQKSEPYLCGTSSEPVILTHGFSGSRSNLLALAAYLRLAGYDNLSFLEYPQWQSVADSAGLLALMAERKARDGGVHLIGHSLGGLISRRFAAIARPGLVRSLITLGSPYSYAQTSPGEVAIFGAGDPLIPPPIEEMLGHGAFGRVVTLGNTGHLALLYHPEVFRIVGAELRANRIGDNQAAA
ncbi:MAG TPA: alpha/beta hydrolase [Candidatus Binataceae bacterium]|nr:alpha/beta hydrolase [Candidatus Binataceae bacterium]